MTEISIYIPISTVQILFGQFDGYIKIIERAYKVSTVLRNDTVKIIGNEKNIRDSY